MTFLDDLKKNVTEITECVAKKSSTVIETQKLKMRKASLESDVRNDYMILGKIYAKVLADQSDESQEGYDVWQKLEAALEAINDIEKELLKTKKMVECSQCKNSVSLDYDFCPKCGATIEKECPDAADEEADVTAEDAAESDMEVDAQESVESTTEECAEDNEGAADINEEQSNE